MKLIPFLLGATILTAPLTVSTIQAHSLSLPQVLSQNIPTLLGVNLSAEQKEQFKQLKQQTRQQIDTFTTQEQRQRFGKALQEGQGVRQAFAAAELSAQQRTQVRQLIIASWEQGEDILTPQQQQKVANMLKSKLQAQPR